ncbi:MAG: phosphoglycerate dehydrogenase, partial [Chlorobium sp.]|nr:phosphoglycerate dehydrogenase [Chlorobium sp.]
MKKILISDSVDEKCAEILKSAGFEVDFKSNLSHEELLDIIPDYNALIVRSKTQVNADLIDKMENIEIIGRAGAGVD